MASCRSGEYEGLAKKLVDPEWKPDFGPAEFVKAVHSGATAISARDFAKSVAEFNFPPIRFRSMGTPGLFLSWIRPAVFFAGLWTDPSENFDRTFTSAGVQLDLRFTLGHRHSMTLSAGYAAGFRKSEKLDDEFMISLKIL